MSFVFLNRSLALEAGALERDIETKRYAIASERIVGVVETCVACHARLPGASEDEFARALTARVDMQALSPLARAEIQAATRQFDAALQTYESQFADRFTPGAAAMIAAREAASLGGLEKASSEADARNLSPERLVATR